MAEKFDLPSLRNACFAFLLPSCAGKPVMGMRIAEENNIPELYKESSRYTLDNFANFSPSELATLSQPTLLKLERKRSWFLERLLELGLVQTSKDYVCQPQCPDPVGCAKLVDEKWRSAWASAFR
ncbi:BTB/POZ-like domain containing protein [Pseudohyphozyma bogoriensis]|nr:BTB/POZ-like domain containing protein [Pseudohyphozyma bogoriensis]